MKSLYYGSKIFGSQQEATIGSFCNGKKAIGLDRQKTSRFSAHFLAFVARLRHKTS